MNASETTIKTGNQMFGLMKMADRAMAVQRSVTKGRAHQKLPDVGRSQATLDEHRVDDRE